MPPLVMFDLDQTLTESKQPLTPHMAELLARLLVKTRVAVISGGGLPQFLKQVVDQLSPDVKLSHLYLLPTSGATLYEWRDGAWQKVYEEELSEKDAAKVARAIRAVAAETGLVDFSIPSYGERIEYRGSQVTFSANGQEAPLEIKARWDPDKSKRRMLQKVLSACLPDFSVGMGGSNSVDITYKGIDKAYGLTKLAERLNVPVGEIVYVGDQLTPGGNDEAVLRTLAKTRAVNGPSETALFIASLLSE